MTGIYEKLIENAEKYPNKTAVIGLNNKYTYSQFLKSVEEKSEELKSKGITRDNTVVVYMDKTEEYLITIYALIKEHIVYAPVESDYPEERLMQIAEIAGCDMIIRNYNTGTLNYKRKKYNDAIYILFTSGSSGKPKGVIVREESILMYMESLTKFMALNESYTSVLKTPINFALALHETFLIFNCSGTIVIPENHSEKNPSLLAECICKNKVNFLDVVPAVLKKLTEQKNADEVFSNIKKIFCAGEVLNKKFADEFRERFDSLLFNAYGMTETNGASFIFDFQKDYEGDSVPIGIPLDCISSYRIIDTDNNDVPDGVTGELCYEESPLLSRYCNEDEVNYITLPSGEKVMKTGDLVKKINGLMYYCGRCDNQVKINGNRVELEEIEKQVEKISFVNSAIAGVYIKHDRNKLIVFIEMTSEVENAEAKIRRFLKEHVPVYMIPAKICFIDKLMRRPNGKKDRKAQIEDYIKNKKFCTDVINKNLPVLQRMLCINYAEIIRNRVAVDTDFFEMGGDSFGMMTLLENIYEIYGVKISTSEFLDNSKITNIEKLIVEKRNEQNKYIQRKNNYSKTYDLTDIQLSYFFDRNYNENALLTSSYRELICNNFDIEKFKTVINKIIKRHDILRTVFNEDGTQTVLKDVQAEIKEVYISDISEAEIKRREYADKKIDHTKAPLIDICVQYISDKKAVIGLHTDGLIMDGRSLQIFTDEINLLYDDINSLLDGPAASFADYVEYKKNIKSSEEYQSDKIYWEERRKNIATNIELPLNKINGCASGASEHVEFSETVWNELEKYAKKNGVTTFVTLLTVIGLSLKVLTKENKYLICIPEDSRPETGEFKNEIGVFSNFMFFEFDGSSGDFINKVKTNQKQLFELKKHHLFSGTENLRELGFESGEVGNGIVPVVFTSIMFDEKRGKNFEKHYFESHSSNIPLEFVLDRISGKVWLTINFVKEQINAAFIEQLKENIENITNTLASGNTAWKNNIYAEISQHDKEVWEKVNDTDAEINYKSITGLIYNSMSDYADSIAIESENKKITYSEMKKIVSGYSRVISDNISDKCRPICIFMEKSPEQIMAVAACIMLGIPYMPLEDDTPLKRLEICLKNTDCETIICNKHKCNELNNICKNIIVSENVTEADDEIVPAEMSEDDLFVIIHTSGSTGVPKAVMITNKSVYNNVMYMVEKYNIGHGDAAIALTNLAHDLSMFDIVAMLTTGSKIVVPSHEKRKDPLHWLEIIKKCGVNIWNSVPAMQEMYIAALNNNMITPNYKMKLFIHGGDYFKADVAEFLYNNFNDAKIVSIGGPTETTIWNISHEASVSDFENGFIPYGLPIANNKYYILDKNLNPVSFGVTGYMYASGVGVAKGYMGSPGKTEEKFINHPVFNVRMYDTGDLGRYLDNGEIEFIGREDFQVKINGKRIETEEIAKVILKCSGVRSSYIAADTDKKAIYAFYFADADIEKDVFINTLLLYLPEYMLPSKFIRLEEYPLTANGKIDRTKLIDMAEKYNVENSSAFINLSEDEMDMKELYDSILDNNSYSPDDPFLIAGGNSLKAVQMVYALKKKYNIEIGMTGFFENSSLRKLSAYVKNLIAAKDGNCENKIEVISENDNKSSKWQPFSLSELQQAYIVGREKNMTLDIVTHVFVEYDCTCYDNDKFLRVVDKLIRRHDVLRMKLSENGTQQFVEEIPEYKIPVVDLSKFSERKQKKYIGYVREKMIRYRLDLNDISLARIHVNILGEKHAYIQFYIDALICDGFSYGILYNEFEALYENENAELASLEFNFKDYIEYIEKQKKTEEYEKAKKYWLKRIETFAEPVSLPFKTKPENLDSLQCEINECNISVANWLKIKNIAEKRGITGFVVLYTAFSEVIARWNFAKKFILNVPVSNRPAFHKDIVNMVGETASFILTEVESKAEETFFETCLRNQKQIWDATDNNLFTGVELLREIYKFNDTYGNNIAPIVFSSIVDTPQGIRKALKTSFWESNTSQVWIDIDAGIINDIMAFNWNTTKGLFDRDMIRDMTALQMELLNKLADDESEWDKRQELELPERDKKYINKAVIDEMDLSVESIQEKIRNSFKLNADRVFVSEEGKEYTYSQTERFVNAKISELKKSGFKENDHVAIVLGKSYEQIVCTLAVICAGGVYVPFEEDCPQKRLEYCLKNTDCKFIISDQSRMTENISAVNISSKLCSESEAVDYYYGNDEDVQAIIHTSGSTGKPKAVMVCQKGIKNSVEYTLKKFEIGFDDVAIALTNLSHDMSMFDLFGMIFSGGKIVVISEKHIKDPVYWIKYIISENVTIWNSVPAMLSMLAQVMQQKGIDELGSIRRVFTGGDYISVPLMKDIKSLMPNAMLVSVGGPTETTLWNIYHIIKDEDLSRDKIPYGRPIANNKYTIRDENGRVAPYGVTGLMYCTGLGVTKGYYNDPDSTAEKYTTDEDGNIMYCTGDLGKYLPDGEIEFMGRNDFQVKINGKRIELNEIENALRQCDSIIDTAVKTSDDGKQIWAYYISETEINESNLKNNLLELLPIYMIPKSFTRMEKFPLSRTNKINKNILPNPEINLAAEKIDISDESSKLIDIAKEVLNNNDISLSDNFFISGGDSLLAIVFCKRIEEEFNITFGITDLFEVPEFVSIINKIKKG